MTPAVDVLKKAKLAHKLHPYEHDPRAEGFGNEAAEKLGVATDRIFKTLVAQTDAGKLVMAVVPVSMRLDLKAIAKAAGAKKADLAAPEAAERATGYVVGGISPLGGRKRLPVVIDESAKVLETMYFSAGRRGLQIEVAPADLAKAASAIFAPIATSIGVGD